MKAIEFPPLSSDRFFHSYLARATGEQLLHAKVVAQRLRTRGLLRGILLPLGFISWSIRNRNLLLISFSASDWYNKSNRSQLVILETNSAINFKENDYATSRRIIIWETFDGHKNRFGFVASILKYAILNWCSASNSDSKDAGGSKYEFCSFRVKTNSNFTFHFHNLLFGLTKCIW